MAEPEDLIVEFAHRGVVSARRYWLRHHPAADTAARGLAGLRAHLELVLAGLVDRPVTLLAADPPAPASWVAWLTRPTPRHLRRIPPVPATDGSRIFLPRTLPPALVATLDPPAAYRLLLVEQVARVRRESARGAPPEAGLAAHFLFELAEAVACDRWIVERLPGLTAELIAARRAMLVRRPPRALLRPAELAVEELVRSALSAAPGEVPAGLRLTATPEESREWAERAAAALPAERRAFRGLPPVMLWGRVLPPSPPDAVPALAGHSSPPARPEPGRTSSLRRAPQPRRPGPDEDHGPMGTWIIRPDEPQESVEDPFGVKRPADRDDEVVPDDLADALSDLPETRVVTTPEPAREVLATEGGAPPRGSRAPPSSAAGEGVAYPEWDYRVGAYRLQGSVVRELPVPPGDGSWARRELARHAALVRQVRRQFAHLRPRRERMRRQADGGEVDIESWVETWADRRAGVAGAANEDRLYVAERAARRSLAITLLIDVSASTDSWVADDRRVIDIEKAALLVVGEALERLGDRYAIFAFSGEGPAGVRVQVVKDFSERGGTPAARRIERLEPDRYTRVGAAIRHATARLAAEPAQRRLLLLLTDGRPNDVDQYEGRYGVEDTRRAVQEAACEGILVFGLTVDRTAPAYLGAMFGPGRAALLRRPERLPAALVDVLRRLLGSA